MKNLCCIFLTISILLIGCQEAYDHSETNILFLHHSTGEIIWNGRTPSVIVRVARKINEKLARRVAPEGILPKFFDDYNKTNATQYRITEQIFPNATPYGWNNFPFDYYNIWVRNAGDKPYMGEPTLEVLTRQYQVIIFKHCFPVCYIDEDQEPSDINSSAKTIGNYKLQYLALRDKLHQFPNTKFILFTGAALTRASVSEDNAKRANLFFDWVLTDWDLPGDNIYIWDMYALQTEGGFYFKDEYAISPTNSHPNSAFAVKVASLLFNRIIDIIENDGNGTLQTGTLSVR